MYAHQRLASLRPCLRPWLRKVPSTSGRAISSSHVLRYTDISPEPEPIPDPETPSVDAVPETQASSEERRVDPKSYNEFLEQVAHPFKHAQGRNWLGGDVPFPLNRSFHPPAPLSDALRTRMYREYMQDPEKNNLRVLAQRYHLSLKRVDAILRLKGLEQSWIKGKPLQTGFQHGMEKVLGVAHTPDVDSRYDVHEADILEEEENRDAARQRYQRLYWESVPEDGREPIVPGSLEHAKMTAKRHAKRVQAHKSDPKLMPIISNPKIFKPSKSLEQYSTKPGRPMIKFIDVGGKFIEVDDRLRRLADSERRAKVKQRHKEEKKAINQKRHAPRTN